ncbi:MAG: hypothetical protein RL598_1655, partial [Verrucomicrobiota bacterium]
RPLRRQQDALGLPASFDRSFVSAAHARSKLGFGRDSLTNRARLTDFYSRLPCH